MNVLQVHTTSVPYVMTFTIQFKDYITSLQQVTIKFHYWSIRFFEHSKQIYTSFFFGNLSHLFRQWYFFFFLHFILKPGTVLYYRIYHPLQLQTYLSKTLLNKLLVVCCGRSVHFLASTWTAVIFASSLSFSLVQGRFCSKLKKKIEILSLKVE